MRRHSLVLATPLLLALPARSGAQNQEQPLRIAASTYALVEVHLNSRKIGNRWYEEDASLSGPSRIAITYGQPHARGRKIEGGLIPNDTVWRLGANMATTLHTDVPITLGTLSIPQGDYSLFLQHRASAWELIVNRGTGQWGTDRDASKDMGRVTMTRRQMAEPEESLTFYLVPQSGDPRSGYADLGGVLRMKWGTTELQTNWTVVR